MRTPKRFAIAACLGAAFAALSQPAPADERPERPTSHPLLRKYRGKEAIPDGLIRVYAAFVQSIPAGDVERYCLPNAVPVTREPRPAQDREYGSDLNLPFLQKGFAADVLSFRKEPDDSYLIRTGTSAIWFVETRSGAWKIYRYTDKPIE